jgi:hypothetical protein
MRPAVRYSAIAYGRNKLQIVCIFSIACRTTGFSGRAFGSRNSDTHEVLACGYVFVPTGRCSSWV